jgi:hypothetical protein
LEMSSLVACRLNWFTEERKKAALVPNSTTGEDRCYDFLFRWKILAQKFGGFFYPKHGHIIQLNDHNIGFQEKRQFFRRKLRM